MFFKTFKILFQSLTFICLCFISGPCYAMDVQVYALFKNMAIIKVDGTQRTLRKDQVSPEGIKLISATSEYAVLEIEGEQQEYMLGEHISSNFTRAERKQARIWPKGTMYHTPGFINGQPVNFLVDTGATWIAMNGEQARKLGINYFYEGRRARVETANGAVAVYRIILDKVRVGEIELRNVEAAVLEKSSPGYLLLGNSFLSRVNIQRDGQMMLLKER